MKVLLTATVVLCGLVGAADTVFAIDGVETSAVVRPRLGDASIKGCMVATSAKYRLTTQDMLEIQYRYPIVPQAIPKKIQVRTEGRGIVEQSTLGIRHVVEPKSLGAGALAAFFTAIKPGEETIILVVDGVEYKYQITVVEKK